MGEEDSARFLDYFAIFLARISGIFVNNPPPKPLRSSLPTCHVTASLRHVRRLESARTPKKTPPSAQTAHAKRAVSRARSAALGVGGPKCDLCVGPPRALFQIHQNPEPHGAVHPKTVILPKKTKKKSPGGIELTTTRRPQQITMGSETMGLTVLLKEPPISPTS